MPCEGCAKSLDGLMHKRADTSTGQAHLLKRIKGQAGPTLQQRQQVRVHCGKQLDNSLDYEANNLIRKQSVNSQQIIFSLSAKKHQIMAHNQKIINKYYNK